MEDSESTARVFVEPSIQLERVSFVDDDDVTFVDRLLNGRHTESRKMEETGRFAREGATDAQRSLLIAYRKVSNCQISE
ncbi:hypothetical protein KCV03_g275, partial [Aureobasidium melanogenum]